MGNDIASQPQKSDYSALLDEYKKMQMTAYQSQSVTTDQLDALKEKLDTFIEKNVTDVDQKSKMIVAFDSEFEAMTAAVELKTKSNKTSNASWDDTRKDMQTLLAELAPEGEEADVYDPTKQTLVAGAANRSLFSRSTIDTSGANLDGVDAYIAQHPEAEPYLEMIKSASVKYSPSTPVVVLLRQIEAESNFNPKALGRFGEQGMTQFTRETWAAYGEGSYDNSWDPQTAINAQANFMSKLQADNGGNLAYALESYNGWERDKSYDYNVSKGCSPTYVQDSTGQPYDQRQDSTG